MAQFVKKCDQCGTLDRRSEWGSADAAAKDPAYDRPWTCSSCAWSEFDLVDISAERGEESGPVNPA